MKPLLALAALLSVACSTSADVSAAPSRATSPSDANGPVDPNSKVDLAYFAGGCFWGVEHFLEQMDGVHSVESGYMGGRTDAPTYEDVLTHESGHLEAVRVQFDPARVSYEDVAKRFFEIHDPTQADGQGPDIGNQYLSAVFYTSDAQKAATEGLISKLRTRGYDVVTELRPAAKFWPAEGYHQDYYASNGKTPYCHGRVKRFGD